MNYWQSFREIVKETPTWMLFAPTIFGIIALMTSGSIACAIVVTIVLEVVVQIVVLLNR